MKQNYRVRLITSNTFKLEQDEIRKLYTSLSLFQYAYLRVPDYDEKVLFKALAKDFKKFHAELVVQSERDPNNLMLSRLKIFFEVHCKYLKELVPSQDNDHQNLRGKE